ncbi:DUF669 domain-containing protein [Gimesia fumaroli]|uniref:DUF669 domain-containing protein n=1 Tax=Gimesia fumaroli TaxID=2527976 RepID=A0A518IKV6_9PLAN|nr:DUF669 domain-containing protein [Gimesia fumaroli]QDV53720.1 hypothetical protein Enr17x_58010 [Gimesia fumaroli]
MANLSGFNANDQKPMESFDPLPADKYKAVIVESEIKPNKKQNGTYLQIKFQIIEGQYQNRTLFARLNLDNPSDIATGIARSELAAICLAVDVPSPNDSAELHNIPLVLNVKCVTRKDNGEVANEIKGYESANQQTQPPAQSAPPVSQSNLATPPWAR